MSASSQRETQPARTALAWQRSALAVVAAVAALARLDWWRLGPWFATPALLVSLLSAAVAAFPARRRHRSGDDPQSSGVRATALVVALLTMAATEAVGLSR